MYWTSQARSFLEKAPWPTTKKDLIDYLVNNVGAPDELIVDLKNLDVDDDEEFHSIDQMWPEVPKMSDFEYYFGDDE